MGQRTFSGSALNVCQLPVANTVENWIIPSVGRCLECGSRITPCASWTGAGRVAGIAAHRRGIIEGVGVHSIPVVVKVAPHSLLRTGAGGAGCRDLGVAIGSGDQGHTLELPLVLGQPVPPQHLPGGAGEVVDLTSTCLEI